jgi:pyruvate/2-oxoglutarate dehydrogenase complex dihydrolipoamide acyltransferase (E2) component
MSNRPATRRITQTELSTIDLGRLGVDKKHVAALLEVDVTQARHSIRIANRGAHSTVSFLAWMVKSVATTLSIHRDEYRGSRSSASEDDIKVSVVVERLIDDRRLLFPVVIHQADSARLTDIEGMIHRARTRELDAASVVCGNRPLLSRLYTLLPGFVRRRLVERTAERLHKQAVAGTGRTPHISITPAGMGGRIRGWFIPRAINAISIGVGAVTQKAVVVNGAIRPREVLHMAFVIEAGLADKTVSSRWIRTLVRAMESGRELSFN